MSHRFITAGMLALMAFGANAQDIDKRPSMEPAYGPFTYEALGATPSLQLGKRTAPDNSETKLAAARERENRSMTTGASIHRDQSATLESPSRSQRDTKRVSGSPMSLKAFNSSSPPCSAADEEAAKLS